MSFAEIMRNKIGKDVSEYLSDKYSLKLLHHAKQSATDAPKTASKREIQKIAEANDLIGNTIAYKITKISSNLL